MNRRSSSLFRVDEQAWLTMGAVCLVALIVLAFRFGTSHPCYPIRITSSAATYAVGSPVSFKAETRLGKVYEWNFGDGATSKEDDPITLHTYSRAGKYTVVITVDGQCSEMQIVSIGEAPITVNNNLPPVIIGPDTAYVGKPVNFEDGTAGSTSWAWHFEGVAMVDAYTRKASHTYLTGGPKKIILEVNHRPELTNSRLIFVVDKQAAAPRVQKSKGDDNGGRPKIISVPEKPVTPPLTLPSDQPKKEEEKPKAPPVTDDKLQSMLLQVVDGTMVQDDFGAYICNNMNIPVMYNGAKTTFSAMCADLKNQKRKKIKKISVTTTRVDATNCIVSMDVTVEKKKSFLGL
ncbi:MAG TPA: PKD domain-containing protein [Puia sp.]|nr:PKD domain-containing protein [Puia sp.]